jgi:hypothetical protein
VTAAGSGLPHGVCAAWVRGMTLEPGLPAAFRYTVTEDETAAALGSGEVPVLATPALPSGHRRPRSPAS